MDWYSNLTRFKKGDRVQLSFEAVRVGIHRWSKQQDRRGTVAGIGTCVRVIWDGNSPKSVSGYHPDYLKHIDHQ